MSGADGLTAFLAARYDEAESPAGVGSVNAMDDWFARNMPDTGRWAADMAAEPVVRRSVVIPEGEPIVIRKIISYIEVPDELLSDVRATPVPLPWRTRLRCAVTDLREQAARGAYRAIAGYWPDSGEDDW